MEEVNRPRRAQSPEPSASPLVELQHFLEEELSNLEKEGLNLKRAFRPLTDGLGLESPKKTDVIFEPPPTPSLKKELAPSASLTFAENLILDDEDGGPAAHPMVEPSKPQETPSTPEVDALRIKVAGLEAPKREKAPPPMPRPGWFRRAQAAIIDEVFVLTLWAGALIITSNVLNGFSSGFSTHLVRDFSRSYFVKFAALEFVTLWLSYLAICVGVLDVTFGMWVWGLRIAYGPDRSRRFLKKAGRILLSFLFFAPVFPTVLLAFRRQGRTLIDILSGTTLYRAPE